jgi:hypothetical protein
MNVNDLNRRPTSCGAIDHAATTGRNRLQFDAGSVSKHLMRGPVFYRFPTQLKMRSHHIAWFDEGPTAVQCRIPSNGNVNRSATGS